jgi:membrane protease YdiL (CAAX protease family)
MLTGTQLDNLLLYTGIGVWAWILYRCIFHGNLLRIDPKPNPSAVRFGWAIIVLVIALYFTASGFVLDFFSGLRIESPIPEEFRDLTFQMLTDCIVKIFAIFGMAMILKRTLDREEFFPAKPITVSGLLDRIPSWLKVFLTAGAIYLAIFPLINKLLLWIGVILADRVFHLPAPPSHQVFQLLNLPEISFAFKVPLILLAAIISPIAEEFFFRGLIQNLAYKNFHYAGSAITFTAMLFTAVHIPMYHQFPALFTLGLVLGWSYYRFQSLLVPIAVHIIFNSVTLIMWSLGVVE